LRYHSNYDYLVLLYSAKHLVPSSAPRKQKLGGCPADDTPCLWQRPDQCSEDSQCPRLKKCCSRACYRQCLPPVRVKLGDCPKDDLLCLSPIQHLCGKDTDCSGIQKCCLAACGRDCREPAKGTCLGRTLLPTPTPIHSFIHSFIHIY
uniref:WAP four-disulfide core domain protein 5 n=1 Tax=Ornithorhynchus anatinus TaxID=9258 RepID=F6W6F2_ORNAN